MISRVTNQTLMQTAQRHLQTNLSRLAELQDRASSQKAFTRPSDDPAAAAEALRIRGEASANAQYGRNLSNGGGWLSTLDTALGSATSLMNEAKDLALQGSNGSISQAAREALALGVESVRSELLRHANSSYAGRSVFAGNSDAANAVNPDLTFNTGGTVERRLGPNVTLRVDADGEAVFGSGPGSVFTLLDTLAADLRGSRDVSVHLGALDARTRAVITQHSEVGTRHARLLEARDANAQQSLALEGRRSAVEDVDLASVILDLKMQETAYQSALAVSARVLQPTLLDFLR
ncbi:flagellar hook-associated protein FlgL [Arthrobacter sp. H41]|uniref:flagellar hook-associated protein FlgL n=1 Tax=Arthrobacter sp. H41 TaxID=1312978 RepID=UPI00047EA3A2|nr:flagellar hook-associated protein FlgL [Arthrobacter sp. H41]